MSQKNIKIKIGDRVYPLTVSESEEQTVTASAEKIAENVKKLKLQYKISDSQDLLAMTCLEFATKLQQTPNTSAPKKPDNTEKLSAMLAQLEDALT